MEENRDGQKVSGGGEVRRKDKGTCTRQKVCFRTVAAVLQVKSGLDKKKKETPMPKKQTQMRSDTQSRTDQFPVALLPHSPEQHTNTCIHTPLHRQRNELELELELGHSSLSPRLRNNTNYNRQYIVSQDKDSSPTTHPTTLITYTQQHAYSQGRSEEVILPFNSP